MNFASRGAAALFAVAAFTLGSTASAQITVTNATFPVAGDTLGMAVDYAPADGTVVLGPLNLRRAPLNFFDITGYSGNVLEFFDQTEP